MRRTNFQGNVHIINFPASTAAADLAALFDDYGVVLGAEIKTIPADGGNLRLGIVSVAPDKAADKAIAALQGFNLGGQKLKLKRAEPRVAPEKKAKATRPKPTQAALTLESAAAAAPGEWYPTLAHSAPPRKVIVEYRGRRPKARVG